jgi:hypothetical protein
MRFYPVDGASQRRPHRSAYRRHRPSALGWARSSRSRKERPQDPAQDPPLRLASPHGARREHASLQYEGEARPGTWAAKRSIHFRSDGRCSSTARVQPVTRASSLLVLSASVTTAAFGVTELRRQRRHSPRPRPPTSTSTEPELLDALTRSGVDVTSPRGHVHEVHPTRRPMSRDRAPNPPDRGYRASSLLPMLPD